MLLEPILWERRVKQDCLFAHFLFNFYITGLVMATKSGSFFSPLFSTSFNGYKTSILMMSLISCLLLFMLLLALEDYWPDSLFTVKGKN